MTTLYPQTWERPLLSLAHEAWHSMVAATRPVVDGPLLDRAYAHCDAVTAQHSKSFYAATRFLPRDKRRAIRALYAFCRVTDDIVDCAGRAGPDCDAERELKRWRHAALAPEPPPGDPVALAWADARTRYGIPHRLAEQLIDGVARDLRQRRYATFDDLTAYAYGVASTVGLMSMRIIGCARSIGRASPEAIPFAIKLGVALQLTNILRDVGEDWRAGRLYLPADELAAFGLGEADVAAGRVTERWRAFMRFQIDRNRRLYDEARPGIDLLSPDGRFAVAAAGDLYRAILVDIEAHDYDVFTRRAHVAMARKLVRLISLWWRYRCSSM